MKLVKDKIYTVDEIAKFLQVKPATFKRSRAKKEQELVFHCDFLKDDKGTIYKPILIRQETFVPKNGKSPMWGRDVEGFDIALTREQADWLFWVISEMVPKYLRDTFKDDEFTLGAIESRNVVDWVNMHITPWVFEEFKKEFGVGLIRID